MLKQLIFINLFAFILCFGQKQIVTEQTFELDVASEKTLYFGFDQNDEIELSFESTNKKMVDIIFASYPDYAIYVGKEKKLKSKKLIIKTTGVHTFNFKNTSDEKTILKLKITRKGSKNFNTNIEWIEKEVIDYQKKEKEIIVSHDTIITQKTVKKLVRSEQNEIILVDKSEQLKAFVSSNSSKSSVLFVLPTEENKINQTKKIVAWAYWIGVDEAGKEAWDKNSNLIGRVVKGVASVKLTPLGAMAIGAITDLITPVSIGEDVEYWLLDDENFKLYKNKKDFKYIDKGKGITGYRIYNEPKNFKNKYHLAFFNDNILQGINVNIKVIAIVETSIYEDQILTEKALSPVKEIQWVDVPITKRIKIPRIIKN